MSSRAPRHSLSPLSIATSTMEDRSPGRTRATMIVFRSDTTNAHHFTKPIEPTTCQAKEWECAWFPRPRRSIMRSKTELGGCNWSQNARFSFVYSCSFACLHLGWRMSHVSISFRWEIVAVRSALKRRLRKHDIRASARRTSGNRSIPVRNKKSGAVPKWLATERG